MSDPITLSGTIPDLLCPGMLATGRFDAGSWVTGRIVAVDAPGERAKYPHHPRCSVGIADNYGMRPFQPEEVEIDLSDSLTLQATVAWAASRLLGLEVGPHECRAVLSQNASTRHPMLFVTCNLSEEWRCVEDEIADIPADLAGTTHGLALAIRSVVIAIRDGRIKVGPNV